MLSHQYGASVPSEPRHLEVQTRAAAEAGTFKLGTAPAFKTSHGPRPSLDRNARYLLAGLTAPELCLPSSSGHLPGALAQLCKLAEHPPPESDPPGSRVLEAPERPGLAAGPRSPRPAASTFQKHVFQLLQAVTEALCVPHFTPTPQQPRPAVCGLVALAPFSQCEADQPKDFLKGHQVQFHSVTQSCPTLCDPTDRSTSGLPVRHQLPEFTQTFVHQVGDAIQPSHPLSSPSPTLNLSQHQGLFQ